MINIEELVAGLKEKGASEEEIKQALESIKAEIDKILNPTQEEPVEEETTEEDEDAKRHEVFAY